MCENFKQSEFWQCLKIRNLRELRNLSPSDVASLFFLVNSPSFWNMENKGKENTPSSPTLFTPVWVIKLNCCIWCVLIFLYHWFSSNFFVSHFFTFEISITVKIIFYIYFSDGFMMYDVKDFLICNFNQLDFSFKSSVNIFIFFYFFSIEQVIN